MTAFDQAVETIRRGSDSATLAAQLYGELTDDERMNLLDGDIYYWQGRLDIVRHGYNIAPYVMGAVNRLGIPGIRFVDGPRGCVSGHGTAFPVSMARGATWNEALEERVGEAIGEEVREQGGNLFGGVCINLPRHPAWGRIQETYSDQPVLLGSLGAALTRGVRRHAMACVKHFACNSMENARFKVDVKVDEATFHEGVRASFQNGDRCRCGCGHDRIQLREWRILRAERMAHSADTAKGLGLYRYRRLRFCMGAA